MDRVETAPGQPTALSPLRYPVFRGVWFANAISSLGGLIQSVGASWMMISIASTANMVALVQASIALPIMLLALPAGALVDSRDRRLLMLGTQLFTAGVLLIIGGLLVFIGSLGLLRMRNFYARMHPPTMGTTLGTGCVLIASMLVSSAVVGHPVVHQLLITLLVVITTPVSAMTLMAAAIARAGAGSDSSDRVV